MKNILFSESGDTFKKGENMALITTDAGIDVLVYILLGAFCGSIALTFFRSPCDCDPECSGSQTREPSTYDEMTPNQVQEWREAARPVFQSRGTVDITEYATPRDLKNYLDPCFAVVWQEHGLEDGCTATSITISSR